MLPFGPTLNIQLRKNFMGKFFFAINKTFLQTTAVQGTIKKNGKETGKIFLAFYIFIQVLWFCVYIHPLSFKSPRFDIFQQNENTNIEGFFLTKVHVLALVFP